MPLLGPNIVKALSNLLESIWLKRKGLGLAFTVNGTSFNSTIFGLFFSAATTDTKWKRHFKSKAPFQNLLREKKRKQKFDILEKKTFVIFKKKMKNDKKIRRWRWTRKNVGCRGVSKLEVGRDTSELTEPGSSPSQKDLTSYHSPTVLSSCSCMEETIANQRI